ncbi:MAG: tryptophan synthase subunit alpha [Candidatus Omnitrophica bacterium]|jgi:tryptophan synthase alpha chain|nr:tryptophan synthase subunit alpha [Candidatus Omnitrophota bacterium]
MNRIETKFKQLRKTKEKAFIAFITAGYPSLEATYKLVLEFAKSDVDIVELGVPFSDPIADGTVIQESSQAALKKKVNLNDILRLVKRLRQHTDIPLCLMTYYNPVFCFGEEKFIKAAKAAGVDGIIVPDLLPEDGRQLTKLVNKFQIDNILFISPTTSKARMKYIASLSKGFIYYVSLTGITGARQSLAADLKSNLKAIKNITSKPVCVGFGISTPAQVREVSGICDGVIVGSAIVKKIRENIKNPRLTKIIGNFVSRLANV